MMSLDTLKSQAKTKAVWSIDWEKQEQNPVVREGDLAYFRTVREQLPKLEEQYEELRSKYWDADPKEIKDAERQMSHLYAMLETEKVYLSVLELMG